VVTSHGEIERVAFRLFAVRGFTGTTLEDIAREAGIGRRTIFRYYGSKNDIPWGQFDQTLGTFRELLDQMPADLPVHEAVHRAVVAFNDFPEDAMAAHRERMRLILGTPELQAHSALRYAEWRAVVAEFVAERSGCAPTDLAPRVAAQVSLALALAAYDVWLADDSRVLTEVVSASLGELERYLRS